MDSSPKGREIKTVEGNPSGVIERGNAIERLGEMMSSCADELAMIAAHDLANGEMDGKAVEKLQEKIGDSHGTLREASQLYRPVGPIIAKYGEELQQWQPLIRSQVDTCQDLWAKFDSMEGAPTHLPGAGPKEGSPEAQQEEDAEEAKDQARKDWENAAETWDGYYDSWEDAYDAAVSGIGNEMSGKIEDGFWEVLDDIIAVLEIVAMVLFVAALFIAGPLAAIAMAVSALVLLARTIQFCAGKCSIVDLGLAVLDVIPFGKFGKMADAVGALTDAGKFAKFSAAYKAAGGVGDAVKLKAFPDIMTSLHAGLDVGDFTRISEYGKIWGAAGDIQGALAKQANSFYSTVNTIQGLPDSAVDIFA
ncbi:hypothetical protein OG801_16490 [Nocardioides sp. NBC_00163]|uniref:hypothetical protein n=1 Tax=Nocardioides sp. NBC_00163 TaxID=2975999 RepID=UPI00325616E1